MSSLTPELVAELIESNKQQFILAQNFYSTLKVTYHKLLMDKTTDEGVLRLNELFNPLISKQNKLIDTAYKQINYWSKYL